MCLDGSHLFVESASEVSALKRLSWKIGSVLYLVSSQHRPLAPSRSPGGHWIRLSRPRIYGWWLL